MELMENQIRSSNDSAKVSIVTGGLAVKDKPTLGDKHSLPSFGKASFIKHKNEVLINCHRNDNKGLTDRSTTFPEEDKSTAFKNIRLNDLQKNCQTGEFINIHQASSDLVFRPVCPYCQKILTTKETLASHFEVCRQLYNYACNKCTYVTWNKSDLDSHKVVHNLKECTKCSLLFANEHSLAVHFRTHLPKVYEKNSYKCKICALSCSNMSSLKLHMKVHAANSESAQFEKNNCSAKEVDSRLGQSAVVVTAKSLYAKEYDVADERSNADSLPLRSQSFSVVQDSQVNSNQDQNVLNSSLSTYHDHDYSKTIRIPSENPKCLTKSADIYREKSSITKRVCSNQRLNCGLCKNSIPQKKSEHKMSTRPFCGLYSIPQKKKIRNKKIVRHCLKCKRLFEFGLYYDLRPVCNFCNERLLLQCTLCYKTMKKYFDAVEHMELECDRQETRDRQKYVESVAKRKSLRETYNGSNLYPNKISSSKNNDGEQQILRHCKGCNINSEFGCYSEQRPSCLECQKKLHLKCILCDKVMTDYFVAVEHTELGCNEQDRLNVEQCNSSSAEKDDCIDDDKNAKVTKICRKCKVRTKLDISNWCKTCYRKSTFQCNRCRKEFGNYETVLKHLSIQCYKEGFYYCLKCEFKSPTKLVVRRHCENQHPEFSDPLGTSEEADYIEYRESQSNNSLQPDLPKHIKRFKYSLQPDSPKSIKRVKNKGNSRKVSRTCQHCEVTFRSYHRFLKHLIHCKNPRAFACKDCPFKTNDKLEWRNHVLLIHLNLSSIDVDSLMNSRDSPPYNCRFCSHVSQRRTALQMHEGHVHARELLILEEFNRNTEKIYQCNFCPRKVVDRLVDLKQHILRIHMKGQDPSKLLPCARCGWNFQSCRGLKKHLAFCGKKLYQQCRVDLVRLNMKPAVSDDYLEPAVSNDNLEPAVSNDNLAETIKEETIDLGVLDMEVDT